MFLEACTEALGDLRKRLPHFPVLKWSEFLDAVHEDVNPLAGIEHIMQATQQLQLMGEVLEFLHDDIIIEKRSSVLDCSGMRNEPIPHRHRVLTGNASIKIKSIFRRIRVLHVVPSSWKQAERSDLFYAHDFLRSISFPLRPCDRRSPLSRSMKDLGPSPNTNPLFSGGFATFVESFGPYIS